MGKSFWVYRVGDDLGRMGETFRIYAQRQGRLPRSLVVNPRLGDTARKEIVQLGMAVDVATVGGCLLGEKWLEVAG